MSTKKHERRCRPRHAWGTARGPARPVGIIAMAVLALTLLSASAHAQPDCAGWNTRTFFKTATAADVATCLTRGADPNARTEYGRTPLHFAARWGTLETVITLLNAGAEIEARTEYYGWTPLHVAARWGTPEMVVALLNAGADPNVRDNDDETPLHRAVKEGTAETVMALLDAGAEIEALDKDGWTR
ncbi:MAG: ankyrin repeat domain-containing protein, partial [Rhodobacteraceae bacterium]|nr:ankyrin repeat domain-containing protein [Paracoccaceae bacterium]